MALKTGEPAMPSPLFHRRVLLFIRAPEQGRVKTRLEKKLGAATVLALYRCFVEDIIETISAGGYELMVFFSPPDKASVVREWLGETIPIRPQTGRTLGEKMRNAFSYVFAADVDQAILMGSDFPDLDPGIIAEAFAFLQKKEAVIGPAEDGGYYLIGFRKDAFDGGVFSGIDWGTATVFRETMQRFRDANLGSHVLPSWRDIDTPDDLAAFHQRNRVNGPGRLKTMQLLKQLRPKGFE